MIYAFLGLSLKKLDEKIESIFSLNIELFTIDGSIAFIKRNKLQILPSSDNILPL